MPTVQVPSLVSIAAGEVVPRSRFRVFEKEAWDDGGWEETDYLEVLQFTECAAPAVPAATFRYRFGKIKREDATTFREFPARKYRDRFVKIVQLPPDPGGDGVSYTHGTQDQPLYRWVGRVTDEAVQTIGDVRGLTGGDQLIGACGLAQELDKNVLNGSVCTNDGEAPFRIDEVLVFNDNLVKGYVETGNRSEAPVADPEDPGRFSYVFADAKTDGVPFKWTARDIAEYLLAWHAPPGVHFELAGAVAVLAEIEPPKFRVAGLTVFQALNQLFDRRRGLGWTVRTNAEGTLALVWVFTTVDADIVFDDFTLPANPDVVDLPVTDLDHLVATSQLRVDTLAKYDQIVVQGESLLVCFSVGFPGNTLEKAWDADLENTYKACQETSGEPLVASTPAAERDSRRGANPRWERVYTTFRIPRTWNWRAKDGLPGSPNVNVNASVANDGRVTIPPSGVAPVRNWGHRLLRHLPLRAAAISGADASGAEPEYLLPFALVRTGGSGSSASPYTYAATHDVDLSKGSISTLRMLDRDFGFEVRASPNHVLAKDVWSPTIGTHTAVPPQLDYRQIAATVAARTDARLRVVVDTRTSGGQGEPDRVLTIDVPNAEFWWIAPGTILGVNPANGGIKRQTRTSTDGLPHPDGPILRDDGERLRAIAALAKAWYGKERGSLTLTLSDASQSLPIGTYVRKVEDAVNFKDVNSVVTSITYDVERTTTTIQTQFGELDVTAGGGPSKHTLR